MNTLTLLNTELNLAMVTAYGSGLAVNPTTITEALDALIALEDDEDEFFELASDADEYRRY